MIARLAYLSLALGVAGMIAAAHAEDASTGVLRLPNDIVFKGPLTGPPQTVVLYGDPSKPGLFVTRIRFSAGWKDMPHWHPDPARTVVVLSGTFYFASGEVWDESKFKAYPAGTFYSEPPKVPHYLGQGRRGDHPAYRHRSLGKNLHQEVTSIR
jgi:quercetin dioxygenase-like cupin family protein